MDQQKSKIKETSEEYNKSKDNMSKNNQHLSNLLENKHKEIEDLKSTNLNIIESRDNEIED